MTSQAELDDDVMQRTVCARDIMETVSWGLVMSKGEMGTGDVLVRAVMLS